MLLLLDVFLMPSPIESVLLFEEVARHLQALLPERPDLMVHRVFDVTPASDRDHFFGLASAFHLQSELV